MRKFLLVAVLAVPFLGPGAGVLAAEGPEQRVMIGVGGGGAGRTWELKAEIYVFPSQWIGVLGGVSYGRSTDESTTYSIGSTYVPPDTTLVWYGIETNSRSKTTDLTVDGLVGLRRPFMDRGFIFLGAGITYRHLDVDQDTESSLTIRSVYDPAWGSVFAASAAVPVGNRWFGFVTLKQRYLSYVEKVTLTTPVNMQAPTDPRQAFTNTYKRGGGGLEATMGIGVGF